MSRVRLSTWLAPAGSATLAGLLIALAPAPALAHEKWFTDRAVHPTDWSLVLSGRTALALGAAAAALGVFAVAQRLTGDPHWPRLPIYQRMARGDMTLVGVQTAITLIYMGVRLTLPAPQLALPGAPAAGGAGAAGPWAAVGYALAALEIAVAFSFITGVLDRAGALALLALGLPVLVLFSPIDLLEQAHYAAVAVAVLLAGASGEVARPRPPRGIAWEVVWGARGVAASRILTGIALLSAALADKVWNPDLGAAFLTERPGFNVFRLLGVGVADDTFVLVVGAIETAIGALLIAGLLTRVVILVMLVPFNLTVPFLPAEEMIGHLPLFGLMYLLLVHGAGAAAAAAVADASAAKGGITDEHQ